MAVVAPARSEGPLRAAAPPVPTAEPLAASVYLERGLPERPPERPPRRTRKCASWVSWLAPFPSGATFLPASTSENLTKPVVSLGPCLWPMVTAVRRRGQSRCRPPAPVAPAGPSVNIQDPMFHATTILAVRSNDRTVLAGDGQVTFGQTVMKQGARKIRRLYHDQILAGFAGSAADSFALFSRFEAKLEQYRGNFERAAVELARDWRTDRALRRLEAMMVVADKGSMFLLSGTGDLIQPDDGIVAIGSGGAYALAAARALSKHTSLDARDDRRERDAHRRGYLHLHQRPARHRGTLSRGHPTPRAHTNVHRSAHPPSDRRRARQARGRSAQGQARGRDCAAESLAAAEAAERTGRGRGAEEHPDDRANGRRQDRDRAAPGQAGAITVHQSRGVEVHRGGVRRAGRRIDGARSRRARDHHGPRRTVQRPASAREAGRRRSATRSPAAADSAHRLREQRSRARRERATDARAATAAAAGRAPRLANARDRRSRRLVPVVRDRQRIERRRGRHQRQRDVARLLPGPHQEAASARARSARPADNRGVAEAGRHGIGLAHGGRSRRAVRHHLHRRDRQDCRP